MTVQISGIGTSVFRGLLPGLIETFRNSTGISVVYASMSDGVAAEQFDPTRHDFFVGRLKSLQTFGAKINTHSKLATGVLGACFRAGEVVPLDDMQKFRFAVAERSVVYGGPTVQDAIDKLVTTDMLDADLKARMRALESGRLVCKAVADGDAGFGITFSNEVLLGGPQVKIIQLPVPLQATEDYWAAITAESAHSGQAWQFLDFLRATKNRDFFRRAAFIA